MHTVFIKKKHFIWFSIFLIVLVALSLTITCTFIGCPGFHSRYSSVHVVQRSLLINFITQDHTLSDVMTNQDVTVLRTPQNDNLLIYRTPDKNHIHSTRTIQKSKNRASTKAQTTNLLFPEASEHPEKLTNKTKMLVSSAAQPLKSSGAEGLVDQALRIARQRGVVLFTVINDAYLDFAASWLCNTGPMEDLQQHVLFLATDEHTGSTLQTLSPHVSVVSLHAARFSGDQEYSHAGYLRLMVERTRQILSLLERGVPLLLFEVDCVWLSNPLPLLLSEGRHPDVVATRVENRTAGGFLLLNPTARTLTLWRCLASKMDGLFEELEEHPDSDVIFWQLNDQEFLSELVKEKVGGVRVSHLPEDLFPDGQWYYKPAKERRGQARPVIINNNFVRGNSAKRSRAREFGHWFLTEDSSGDRGFTCNASAVQAVLGSPVVQAVP